MQPAQQSVVETRLFIDGEWRPSVSGRRYEVRNPAWPE